MPGMPSPANDLRRVSRLLLPALATALVAAGCGDEEPTAPASLERDALVVLDWARADPPALCDTPERAADREPGRRVLRTVGRIGGRPCHVAVRADRPVATGADVTAIETTADGRVELRLGPAARARLRALGPDAHVGVVHDDRLLDVVFPADGRIAIDAP